MWALWLNHLPSRKKRLKIPPRIDGSFSCPGVTSSPSGTLTTLYYFVQYNYQHSSVALTTANRKPMGPNASRKQYHQTMESHICHQWYYSRADCTLNTNQHPKKKNKKSTSYFFTDIELIAKVAGCHQFTMIEYSFDPILHIYLNFVITAFVWYYYLCVSSSQIARFAYSLSSCFRSSLLNAQNKSVDLLFAVSMLLCIHEIYMFSIDTISVEQHHTNTHRVKWSVAPELHSILFMCQKFRRCLVSSTSGRAECRTRLPHNCWG